MKVFGGKRAIYFLGKYIAVGRLTYPCIGNLTNVRYQYLLRAGLPNIYRLPKSFVDIIIYIIDEES